MSLTFIVFVQVHVGSLIKVLLNFQSLYSANMTNTLKNGKIQYLERFCVCFFYGTHTFMHT